ncbi:MAG: NADH-quinone oxidoreductase subunit C/D [Armatimonadota bacterium]|jgi:NADH-quinone oxidoreductase subunit C/D
MVEVADPIQELQSAFGDADIQPQPVQDGIPTAWVPRPRLREILKHLQSGISKPYRALYDVTAIDERTRLESPPDYQGRDFTLVYHLLSYDRNEDVRIKVAIADGESVPTVTEIWPAANWYEREVWDMFGVRFDGHPFLERILMPRWWKGHPLRKEHPARATEMEPYQLPDWRVEEEEAELQFHPEHYGLPRSTDHSDYMFLNVGPHHPGTHGLLRIVLQLDGEEIVNAIPDIGYHHRAVEKMAERQTYHTFIPYTDRVDYLAGVQNELPYLLAVEKLAGIEIPPRAQVIRVMLCELFRIISHLVFLGTLGTDVGSMSPVFYTFTDREQAFHIVEAICGYRMHPEWFRIGGVAENLPNGWKPLVDEFVRDFRPRIDEYEKMLVQNAIFRGRTVGVGPFAKDEAIEWGVTGPNLRATGVEWDFRKKRPYSSYDQFDFEIPTADAGDCYARTVVRLEEMRQSLRIIAQAASNMPEGHYKSDHPLTHPPRKEGTMLAIETLIHHFLAVSWGHPIPAGEAHAGTEMPKGNSGYYVISDGGTHPYRVRIRAPSFAHLQTLPLMCRGFMISDLLAILGSIDFVLADVDR